jgi:hypothetical protein
MPNIHPEIEEPKMGQSIVVTATWDPEVNVWVAESDDLPLVTEAPSMDALMAKLPGLIEELIEEQGREGEMIIPLEVIAHIHEKVRIPRRS